MSGCPDLDALAPRPRWADDRGADDQWRDDGCGGWYRTLCHECAGGVTVVHLTAVAGGAVVIDTMAVLLPAAAEGCDRYSIDGDVASLDELITGVAQARGIAVTHQVLHAPLPHEAVHHEAVPREAVHHEGVPHEAVHHVA